MRDNCSCSTCRQNKKKANGMTSRAAADAGPKPKPAFPTTRAGRKFGTELSPSCKPDGEPAPPCPHATHVPSSGPQDRGEVLHPVRGAGASQFGSWRA